MQINLNIMMSFALNDQIYQKNQTPLCFFFCYYCMYDKCELSLGGSFVIFQGITVSKVCLNIQSIWWQWTMALLQSQLGRLQSKALPFWGHSVWIQLRLRCLCIVEEGGQAEVNCFDWNQWFCSRGENNIEAFMQPCSVLMFCSLKERLVTSLCQGIHYSLYQRCLLAGLKERAVIKFPLVYLNVTRQTPPPFHFAVFRWHIISSVLLKHCNKKFVAN